MDPRWGASKKKKKRLLGIISEARINCNRYFEDVAEKGSPRVEQEDKLEIERKISSPPGLTSGNRNSRELRNH